MTVSGVKKILTISLVFLGVGMLLSFIWAAHLIKPFIFGLPFLLFHQVVWLVIGSGILYLNEYLINKYVKEEDMY